ncbi:hypothetical protein MPEAHAMD_4457 [Methylobacterium frigidaeris]|uniref:Methyltransferase FkbM domain-containing protein n=2 Tax=Methylobacterium frigidaeris TaxID=2038277 RepID=A0AA37HE13_9HYPH|nr:hypothetical protein MPEAHAMD_4457 [Methylobacterium frigidaeris]
MTSIRFISTRVDRASRVISSVMHQRRSKLPPLRLLDVGALFGLQPRWEMLRKLGIVTPILCEPDRVEAARLRKAYLGATVLECALGAEEGSATLHVARDPGKSSLLRPNLESIGRFEEIAAWQIIKEFQVPVRPLDDVLDRLEKPDFIKIDVQGYELEVLKGAARTLHHVAALEIETSVVPLYHNQPTHSEVTAWLIDRGFHPVATKTTGTFGGEGVRAVEYDSFFVNNHLLSDKRDGLQIWLTTNRIRRGGSWDRY